MSNKFDYLSDEELLRLIDCAEGDGLLSAPHDLKENTLDLICHSEGAQRLKNPEEGSFASLWMTGEGQADSGTGSPAEQKRKNAKKQFYRYCARVALGCAASASSMICRRSSLLMAARASLILAVSSLFLATPTAMEVSAGSVSKPLPSSKTT